MLQCLSYDGTPRYTRRVNNPPSTLAESLAQFIRRRLGAEIVDLDHPAPLAEGRERMGPGVRGPDEAEGLVEEVEDRRDHQRAKDHAINQRQLLPPRRRAHQLAGLQVLGDEPALAFEQATEWKDRHPKLNA